MSNQLVQGTISEELNQKLEKYMERENRTRSQVIRMALADYLEAERNQSAIACAMVELSAQINKLEREYGDVIPQECITELNQKVAVVIATEGR